jgi:hypothetical protein
VLSRPGPLWMPQENAIGDGAGDRRVWPRP